MDWLDWLWLWLAFVVARLVMFVVAGVMQLLAAAPGLLVAGLLALPVVVLVLWLVRIMRQRRLPR